MSKFGWDLPPGCRMSDIPGNRPEDLLAEAQYDAVETALSTATSDEERVDRICKMLNEEWERGYQQAISDHAEARYYKEQEKQHET